MLTSKQIYDRLITAYGQPDWWPGTLRQRAAWGIRQSIGPQDTSVTKFDEGLWGTIVDFMTIYSKEDISVTFKDGTEIHIG